MKRSGITYGLRVNRLQILDIKGNCRFFKKSVRTQGPQSFELTNQHIITLKLSFSLPLLVRIWSNKRVGLDPPNYLQRLISLLLPAQFATCNNTNLVEPQIGFQVCLVYLLASLFLCSYSLFACRTTLCFLAALSSAFFARSLLFCRSPF